MMIKRIRPTKFFYYLGNIIQSAVPAALHRAHAQRLLKRYHARPRADIEERVAYCNRLQAPFTHSAQAVTLKELDPGVQSTYYFDFKRIARYFPAHCYFDKLFGDVRVTPPVPTFVKSRPLSEENSNSVLLKLNAVRHFRFVQDDLPFKKKRNKVVWRGATNSKHHRADMLRRYFHHPRCDVGVNKPFFNDQSTEFMRPSLTLQEQLQYKFILSLEGKDVATNLKWIMSSNSLAFMRRPRYETWFMEGRLLPGIHYVLLQDDFSDLEEKMDYYSTHIGEAQEIIANANRYVEQFRDARRERLVSLLVMEKYFSLSGQA